MANAKKTDRSVNVHIFPVLPCFNIFFTFPYLAKEIRTSEHNKQTDSCAFSVQLPVILLGDYISIYVSTPHTDLGMQYTSSAFAELVANYRMIHSFSQKECPYDNACIESFHAIWKKEEVHHVRYENYEKAKIELFRYIEGWYNRKRIHSSLGYKTPQAIEDGIQKAA